MNLDEYRKSYEMELTKARTTRSRRSVKSSRASRQRGTRELIALIKGRTKRPAARVAAIDEASNDAVSKPSVMKLLITVLADGSDDATVRHAALGALQQNGFNATEFGRYEPDFLASLRVVATDPDPELRERAMETLSLRNDEYVQRLLIDGLHNPKKALVKPERALRMIGYDVHAEHYSLLRDIVRASKKHTIRRAALRLLAADSDSKDLFVQIANDKSEDTKARVTSAIALQSLAPDRFESIAREVVLDNDDRDDVRATFLNALSHTSTASADADFGEKVRTLQGSTPSGELNRAARQFVRLAERDS